MSNSEFSFLEAPKRKRICGTFFFFAGVLFVSVGLFGLLTTFFYFPSVNWNFEWKVLFPMFTSLFSTFMLFGLNACFTGIIAPNYKTIKWERIEFKSDEILIYKKDKDVNRIPIVELENIYVKKTNIAFIAGPFSKLTVVVTLFWDKLNGRKEKIQTFYFSEPEESTRIYTLLKEKVSNEYNFVPEQRPPKWIFRRITVILSFVSFIATVISFISFVINYGGE